MIISVGQNMVAGFFMWKRNHEKVSQQRILVTRTYEDGSGDQVGGNLAITRLCKRF
jgi:hypothetical protein